MCDTFVVVNPGRVLFAKNSDRDPNEAQVLSWVPELDHESGTTLRCTWSHIPQVEHTHAMLLSRPFWMWGAEIGINEHGVAIGNEAIFAHEPLDEDGLLGMDLVRLGLERGATAESAKNVICELIERYGQGGRCAYEKPGFSYHNSFLVADANGAWVIEAAGRQLATRHVTDGVNAISNSISLPKLASRRDRIRSWVADADKRRERVQCLAADVGDVHAAMNVLRDHGSDDDLPHYTRLNGAMSAACMHAGGWLAAGQTVASLVSELTTTGQQHWATGAAAPCMNLFRPVSLRQARDVGTPTGIPDESLWWRFESVHRRLLCADLALREQFMLERDDTQQRLLQEDADTAWQTAEDWLTRWQGQLASMPTQDSRPGFLRRYWRSIEVQAAAGSLLPWRDA
jgi:dipeptidase